MRKVAKSRDQMRIYITGFKYKYIELKLRTLTRSHQFMNKDNIYFVRKLACSYLKYVFEVCREIQVWQTTYDVS